MSSTTRCRSEHPLTCRVHGRALAAALLLPGAQDRDFGLPRVSLDEYAANSVELRERLTPDERDSLRYYTSFGYSYVNGFLRRGHEGLIDAEIHDNFHHEDTPANRQRAARSVQDLDARMREEIANLDAAFVKADAYDTPRVLYKAFRVRSVTGNDSTSAAEIKAHVSDQYPIGKILRNKAYTSTSIDPDYMLVHARRRPSQIIVHEIVTDRGLPLHDRSTGSIQSAEREILLPRDIKLEVVNVTRANFIHSGLGPDMGHWGLRVPPRKRFTVVQFREVV